MRSSFWQEDFDRCLMDLGIVWLSSCAWQVPGHSGGTLDIALYRQVSLPLWEGRRGPSARTRCLSMVPGDTRPLLFLCKGNTLQSLTWPLLHILQSPTQSTPPRHASLDLCLPQQDESRSLEHRLGLGRQPTPLRSCVVMGNSLSPSALIGRMGMIVRHCPRALSWT